MLSRFLDILQSTYADADVVCIQEAGDAYWDTCDPSVVRYDSSYGHMI